ncbi:hypothetical protein Btru_025753 [Bulinus truncatus]|nr:hypothetical protein Btru_025753 [Bulinus truncatus]
MIMKIFTKNFFHVNNFFFLLILLCFMLIQHNITLAVDSTPVSSVQNDSNAASSTVINNVDITTSSDAQGGDSVATKESLLKSDVGKEDGSLSMSDTVPNGVGGGAVTPELSSNSDAPSPSQDSKDTLIESVLSTSQVLPGKFPVIRDAGVRSKDFPENLLSRDAGVPVKDFPGNSVISGCRGTVKDFLGASCYPRDAGAVKDFRETLLSRDAGVRLVG